MAHRQSGSLLRNSRRERELDRHRIDGGLRHLYQPASVYRRRGAKIGKRVDGMVVPEIVDILIEGDKLVFRWDGSGKMADGTPYHNRYSWAMTFKDGKVVEGTAYLDTALVDTLMDLPDS